MTNFSVELENCKKRFIELETALQDTRVLENSQKLKELSCEYTDIKEIVEMGNRLHLVEVELSEASAILQTETDAELRCGSVSDQQYRNGKKSERTHNGHPSLLLESHCRH